MFKPSQQRPTQEGTDVGGPVISPPLRMRANVQASPTFFKAMEQTGITPDAVASHMTNAYAGFTQRFVDATRQFRDIAGHAQVRRHFHVPGLDIDYRSNYGAETLEYTIYPEANYGEEVGGTRTDVLLDGYIMLTIFPAKVVPVPTETYWVEIGGIKYKVDRVAVGPPAHDAGVGWTPFNPDIGSFDPDAWVVGNADNRMELVDPDVTTVDHSSLLTWRDPDLNLFNGGWEIPAVPIPDHDATVQVFNNGVLIATAPVPITDTTTFTTVVLAFGKDALIFEGVDDANQPDPSKILRKILPEPPLLIAYPFLREDVFHPVRSTTILQIGAGLWEQNGSNLFTVTTSEELQGEFAFAASFYDRRHYDKVAQSPHYGPSTDGSLITCNDRLVTWSYSNFSADSPALVDFQDPSARPTGGGGSG